MAPLLTTKLYAPSYRTNTLSRPRLVAKLNEHLPRKLTLLSAPAGFGKTTLLSEWLADPPHPIAWLSLDEEDGHPSRFFLYVVAALQTIAPDIGNGLLDALQSPQPPSADTVLTVLLNDLAARTEPIGLVLDDYHAIDAPSVDQALTFLLKHQPPQLHLIMATREDPQLPLARLRGQGQLLEIRAEALRFHTDEAERFFHESMQITLTKEDVIALEDRTEGWIAGLQLAALSLRGQTNPAQFVRAFAGSHHFVMDYLLEEVLQKQPPALQAFLLQTSILRRFCGPLCDAIYPMPSTLGQTTLESLAQANLFLVPLDDERRWFRYHHLFGDLLRQRLEHAPPDEQGGIATLHRRASQWFTANGLDAEAFDHAVASGDTELCAQLVEGEGMPLHFRGVVAPVLQWLSSLPKTTLDTRPSLWVIYASALLFVGQMTEAAQKIQAAEIALQGAEEEPIRDLLGHIAAIHATLAAAHQHTDTILAQSQRALAYLHPDNLPVRTAMKWTLGYAYHLQGQRAAARQAYQEAATISRAIGHVIIQTTANIGLAILQELDDQPHEANRIHQEILASLGRFPPPIVSEVYFGLARIAYESNDLAAAQQHIDASLQHMQRIETPHRIASCKLFLARLKQAQGDPHAAARLWTDLKQYTQQHPLPAYLTEEIATFETRDLLFQGKHDQAEPIAHTHQRPDLLARVLFAKGDYTAAMEHFRRFQAYLDEKHWPDEKRKATLFYALLLYAMNEKQEAYQTLHDVLFLAESHGLIRFFLDEGSIAIPLFSAFVQAYPTHAYAQKILQALPQEAAIHPLTTHPSTPTPTISEQPTAISSDYPPLIEPLTPREREILQLIEQGLSNEEIAKRLFLSLSTIKGHNQNIFAKLSVRRRTEAIARARTLGLL